MTDVDFLREEIVKALRTVYDPEIPVNLYDLGLIYDIDIKQKQNSKYSATITMTLTTPNCPVAGTMPEMVRVAIAALSDLEDVVVNLVWDPPWDKNSMSEEAKFMMGMI